MSSSTSVNRIDNTIKDNPNLDDAGMKYLVENLLRQDYKVSGNTFRVLCSQRNCRPKTLRFLINYYRRNVQTFQQDVMERIMSEALRFFVKYWHDCRSSQIRTVIQILLQNGADPFEKNRYNLDAFDYAHFSGDTDVIQNILRTSPRNPIRRINQMIARENAHPQSRQYIVQYLNSVKRYFTDQSVFHAMSIRTPFTSHRERNV